METFEYKIAGENIKVSSLVELLRHRTRLAGDEIAYTFLDNGREEANWTYADLDRRARAISVQLRHRAKAGDRILLLFPPGLDFLAGFFGSLYSGMIAVPTCPPTSHALSRFKLLIDDSEPVAALISSSLLPLIDSMRAQDPGLNELEWIVADRLPLDLADEWRDPRVDNRAQAFLQYTSGSTSSPRGVMVSHGNLLYNLRMLQTSFQHLPEAPIVSWLPIFHDMGLIGKVLLALHTGSRCIQMSPVAFVQRPLRWLQAISHYQAYTSGAPNFAYDLCARKITQEEAAGLNLSNWRVAFNGSEPVRRETLERFLAAFGSCGFRQDAFLPAYGLAEATLIVSGGVKKQRAYFLNLDGKALEQNQAVPVEEGTANARNWVGCGQTLLGQKIIIVDPESGIPCPPNQIGEIWVSGPSVASGYWNKPIESERTFRARLANGGDESFLRTGDLGFLRDGELFITGRLKDIIIIDGRNHYPQDIELTVGESHSAIRTGCISAFSVELNDEEKLVVVAEVDRRYHRAQSGHGNGVMEGELLDIGDIIKTVQRAVAQQHDIQAHAICLIKPHTIAKTTSGKIQRYACRKKFLDGTLSLWSEDLENTAAAMGGQLAYGL